MRQFLLTLDYELYGDGSGDVFCDVIEPTERLISYFDENNIKVTIFVEMVEFLRMKQAWSKGNNMGYDINPYEAVVSQIQKIYSHGHDVQLHIHPQWVDAKYENGKWHVDNKNWILGLFDRVGDVTLKSLLQCCKNELEAMVRPIDPNYQCLALRAGGYNVQPSRRLVEAMTAVGLKLDSSVVPGAVQKGTQARYDFSSCNPRLDYWQVNDTLENPAQTNTGLYELPLTSMPLCRFLKLFSRARMKAILKNSSSAKSNFNDKVNTSRGNSFVQKAKYLFETEYITWDFCLMHRVMHRKFIKHSRGKAIIVLVGHPKGFSTIDTIKSLVDLTGNDATFSTVTQLYRMINNGNESGN